MCRSAGSTRRHRSIGCLGYSGLVRILHPRVFPEPLGPRVKDFHTRYYHRTLTDAQVRTLLEQAGIAQ